MQVFVTYFENMQTSFYLHKNMKRQERTVVHLEMDGQHYYYGNLKALFERWGVEALGASYAKLRNYGISADKPFIGNNYTIRKGILLTTHNNYETH